MDMDKRIRIETVATWRQAGVIVADGSGSMHDQVSGGEFTGTKGEAVGLAVQGLLSRFQVSVKAPNFSFAGVSFDSAVRDQWGPVPATGVDLTRDYDPTRGAGGGTAIATGLEVAQAMVTRFLDARVDGLPSSAVVLLLTDGEDSDPEATRKVAARLTADPRVRLACAFLATKGAQQTGLGLLQSIASKPTGQYCLSVYDPETLRKFWTASLTLAALPAGRGAAAPR